jgi:hypothetical protein
MIYKGRKNELRKITCLDATEDDLPLNAHHEITLLSIMVVNSKIFQVFVSGTQW